MPQRCRVNSCCEFYEQYDEAEVNKHAEQTSQMLNINQLLDVLYVC